MCHKGRVRTLGEKLLLPNTSRRINSNCTVKKKAHRLRSAFLLDIIGLYGSCIYFFAVSVVAGAVLLSVAGAAAGADGAATERFSLA